MKANRHYRKTTMEAKAATIRTSLMEILQALTSQTKDDALVVESLTNIFASYRVRFGQTMAPIRLASAKPSQSLRRANLGR